LKCGKAASFSAFQQHGGGAARRENQTNQFKTGGGEGIELMKKTAILGQNRRREVHLKDACFCLDNRGGIF
jgi:hypothetical protein